MVQVGMNGRGAPLAVSYARAPGARPAAFTPPPACGPAVYDAPGLLRARTDRAMRDGGMQIWRLTVFFVYYSISLL